MRAFLFATATLSLSAAAQAQQWRPLDTREEAWLRQHSEQYQWQRRNPNSLNLPQSPLGDPTINATQREQQQWGVQQPAPYRQPQRKW